MLKKAALLLLFRALLPTKQFPSDVLDSMNLIGIRVTLAFIVAFVFIPAITILSFIILTVFVGTPYQLIGFVSIGVLYFLIAVLSLAFTIKLYLRS